MTYRVNYPMLAQIRNGEQRLEAMQEEIAKCDYLCLTDALSHTTMGGPLVLQWLEDELRRNAPTGNIRKFRIHVIRDEWGREPPAFMFVERKIQLPLRTRAGKRMSNRMANDMRRMGTFESQFVITRRFDLDERGCFEASYEDAGAFLATYGIHFQTKTALPTNGHRELSGGQCVAPDGSLKHIWNWRYEEAPPWIYEKLPIITKDKQQRK